MIRGGITYRILHDHVGSPRLVVNVATGAIAARINYDTFGNIVADTNPGLQPFGFAGALHDRDTGLVRFGNRDYDPRTGRFTTKDISLFEGAVTNAYAYADGDPINRVDRDGRGSTLAGCAGANLPACAIAFEGFSGAAVGIKGGGFAAGAVAAEVTAASTCLGIAGVGVVAGSSPNLANLGVRTRAPRVIEFPPLDPAGPRFPPPPGCREIAVICRANCLFIIEDPKQDEFAYFRCVNECLEDNGCPPGMY